MGKLITIVMYFLWILAILSVLATTFTDFQYEDLNAMAIVFTVFAALNSYLTLTVRKK